MGIFSSKKPNSIRVQKCDKLLTMLEDKPPTKISKVNHKGDGITPEGKGFEFTIENNKIFITGKFEKMYPRLHCYHDHIVYINGERFLDDGYHDNYVLDNLVSIFNGLNKQYNKAQLSSM